MDIDRSSGNQTVYDQPAAVAAQIAANGINAKGGILGRKIKFIYADTKGDPAQSAARAQSLISQGAQILIATCDYDTGGPAARIAQAAHILTFSMCASSPKWNTIGPLAYSMTFGSVTEGATGAQWAYQGPLHCKTGYILTDTLIDYTKTVGAAYKTFFKGKIVGEDTFANTDSSFSAQVTRLQGISPAPQCIFIASFPPGGATLLRQMRAAGISQPVIGPDGFDGNYWISAIPDLSNLYYTGYASVFGDDPMAAVNKLFSQVAAATHTKTLSGSTAICGYSIMQALQIAITKAGSTDGPKVAAALANFKNVPLLIGPTTFSTSNRISPGKPMRIMQVKDGKFSFDQMFTATGVGTT